MYSFLGSLPWCFALAFAGQQLGNQYRQIGTYLHGFDAVIAVALVAGIAAYIWRHVRSERAYDANIRLQERHYF